MYMYTVHVVHVCVHECVSMSSGAHYYEWNGSVPLICRGSQ